MSHQGKTRAEADQLWNQFHTAKGIDMTSEEFERLVHTGFDVGVNSRSDLSSVLTPRMFAVDRGFWGSGTTCPPGLYAIGARLKRALPRYQAGTDNTGLDAVDLHCGNGTHISSIEAYDREGVWSDWQYCPPGQVMFGARVQTQTLDFGRDNSALNDVEFECKTRGDSTASHVPMEVRFPLHQWHTTATVPQASAASSGRGAGTGSAATGTHRMQGGWTENMVCGTAKVDAALPKEARGVATSTAAICGVQVRLRTDQDEGDDMGVTDIRFYCCDSKPDCTTACSSSNARVPTAECAACRRLVFR